MTREREGQNQHLEVPLARPLTQGEFYLAMIERPDPNGLGLRPELRIFFVGQERAYRLLHDAITQTPPGTVVALTGPFGSGKDTLFDVVINDLMVQGKIKGEEAQRVHVDIDLDEDKTFEQTRKSYSWVDKPKDPITPKVLAVNDVACGWGQPSKESLQRQLAIAGKFLGKEVSVMVLLGDYALEDPEIVGVLGSPNEPIIIKLDPLTPDMLKEALRQRMAYALERSPEDIDVDAMVDNEVLSVLTPNTEYPVATMRNALIVFGSIGSRLKTTEEPLRITPDLVRKLYIRDGLYRDFWEASDQKQQFMLWGLQHIKNHDNGRSLMRAMTMEEMQQACPLNLDQRGYERMIRELRNTPDWLLQVGSYPNRYLPRQDYFLRAALRTLPLDPASEEGKTEVKRMQDLIYRMARRPISREGLSYWETLIEKMRSIYGWDINFSKGLIVEVLESYTDRLKAEKEEAERNIRGE